MRVVFVIPYFYPAWAYGGQPRAAYELARGLVHLGHQVHVLTSDSGGPGRLALHETGAEGRRIVDGIEVTYFRNVSSALAYRRCFIVPAYFRNVRRYLQGADILHLHELRSTMAPSALSAAKALNVPLVLSPHGGLSRLGRDTLKRVYDAAWGRRILRDAARVLAVSPQEEEEARRHNVLADRIRLLPNPVDTSVLDPPARGLFRKKFGIQAHPLVLFMGRLNAIKGPDLLVEAVAQASRDIPGLHLALCGPDDGFESTLRKLITQRGIQNAVTFCGLVDGTLKQAAFADADLTVVPSRREVFALTAVESLLAGTPVLLSSACGLYPMPAADAGVTLFRVGDPTDLAARLTHALKHPTIDVRAAREFVTTEFSVESVARRAEQIYRDVL